MKREELKKLIHSFPNSKASGVLGMSQDMLKNLNDRNIDLLNMILNDVIDQKHFIRLYLILQDLVLCIKVMASLNKLLDCTGVSLLQ